MEYPAGYQPANKYQQFDEEQQQQHAADSGPPNAAWVPMSQDKVQDMRDKDEGLKARVRTMRVIVRVLAFALSCFMLYSQVYMLNKYLSTRGYVFDNRNAWAKQTTIWPTIVLLISSGVTVLITAIMLVSYAWGVKHSNWAATRLYMPWITIEILAHAGLWIATVIAYRVGKTGNDLWGWSCSDKAAAIQIHFQNVDFSFACGLQGNAWAVSIAEMVLVLLSGIAWSLAWYRSSHQKKLHYRESLMQRPYYDQNGPGPAPAW